MPKLNENYQNLKESYLFVEIAHRVAKYAEANPDKKIIRLGIGDVTLPLEPLAVEGLHEGVDAMTSKVMVRNRAMIFSVRPLSITMLKTAYPSRPMTYSFPTALRATQEISATYLLKIMWFLSRTRYTRFMWTPTL